MRLWADVYDPTGTTRLGAGGVMLRSASVRRVLDGPGRVNISTLGTDERALDLMQPKRVVKVYTDGVTGKRELGAFVVDSIRMSDSSSKSLAVSGRDLLALLGNTNTGLGRAYSQQAVSAIVSGLAGLAGWSASVTDVEPLSVRFDGSSVLKALQVVAEQRGLHLRLGTGMAVEVGTFGVDSGVRAEAVKLAHRDMYANDKLLMIETVELLTESADVVNAVLPLGAGDGDAVLTLAQSTRGGVTVRSGGDGRDEYWLEDAASIAQYGRVERRLDFNRIAPVTNSSADVENAANALYDAATVWLARHKQPRNSYKLACRKADVTVQAGDKLTLSYKGDITDGRGNVVDVRDVRGLFWVLSVTERWGVEGGALDLEIADVDTYNAGEAGIVVGALDAIQVQGVAVKPFPFVNSYVYRRELDSTHDATVPLDVTDAVLDLTRVRVRITSRPFRSTAKGAAAGGATASTSAGGGVHNHRVLALTSYSGFPYTSDYPYLGRNSNGGSFSYLKLSTNGQDIWTYDASDSHTHDFSIPSHAHGMLYGIYDDTQEPDTIRLAINGADVTAALGGPWGVGGGTVNTVVEVSDLLKAGGLQRLHELAFSCDGGQGEIEVTVEVYGVMQSIRVS